MSEASAGRLANGGVVVAGAGTGKAMGARQGREKCVRPFDIRIGAKPHPGPPGE